MPTTNFPFGLTSFGIPVLGSGPVIPVSQGVYWFVDSVNGKDGNSGKEVKKAFATLAQAVSKASAGDVIILLPGHAETISSATALTLSVAGVSVVGLGTGNRRPTFTLDTANTATINVTANGVRISNVVFVANFLAIAALFTLTTATDFHVVECEVRDTSSILNFIAMVVTDTTSNHADGLVIRGCSFFLLATSGAVKLASALGTNDRWSIIGNFYQTPTTNAGAVMPIAAGKVLTNLKLLSNYFNLVNAAGTATAFLITTNGSTNTGFIDGNIDHALPTTPLLVTASSGFVFGLNYHSDTADLSGYLVPGADS